MPFEADRAFRCRRHGVEVHLKSNGVIWGCYGGADVFAGAVVCLTGQQYRGWVPQLHSKVDRYDSPDQFDSRETNTNHEADQCHPLCYLQIGLTLPKAGYVNAVHRLKDQHALELTVGVVQQARDTRVRQRDA